ncbi:ATP-binding cassette domain-containing protein [Anaerosporobacter sp.]
MEVILRTEDLSIRFGNHLLFSNANLMFEKGKTIALIGPNGTGKSTLLKIIAGIVKPTKGYVIYDPNLKFNYVPDRFPKLNLNMEELLTNMAVLDGLEKEESQKKLEYYYDLFQVKEMIHTPLKYLSKGTLQKVSVIQALMGKSDILLLDEPLSGQDIVSERNFIKEIKKLQKKDTTILLCCHEPYLIDQLADKVYEIKGQLWKEKKTELLDYADNTVVTVSGYPENLLKEWLISNGSIKVFKELDKTILFCSSTDTQRILLQLLEDKYEITDCHMFGREEDYIYVKSIHESR